MYANKGMHKRIVLIVSIAAMLIPLAGCAASRNQGQEPLSGKQTEYAVTNAQYPPTRQFYDGFSMELQSVIPVNNTVYAVFGLTAPEDVNLSDVLETRSGARLTFPDLQAMPSASDLPANISCDVMDDRAGKKNALKVVMKVSPVIAQGADSAFGPGKSCEIVFREIVKRGYDQAYEQELAATKYAGQTNYAFTPEEAERVYPKTLLVSGEWRFVIDLESSDSGELELLESPVSTKAWVVRSGTTEFEAFDTIEDVTLTSVRVTPICVEISFAAPEPSDTFCCVNFDTADFPFRSGTTGYGTVSLVLKDGTSVSLFQARSAVDTAALSADRPFALEEVDYLQMPDGTKLRAK